MNRHDTRAPMANNSQDVGYRMWDVEAANNHDTKLPVIPLLDRGIQIKQPGCRMWDIGCRM